MQALAWCGLQGLGRSRVSADPNLADRTTLTPEQIADLLTFVLRSIYFQYNGSIHEQKDGHGESGFRCYC